MQIRRHRRASRKETPIRERQNRPRKSSWLRLTFGRGAWNGCRATAASWDSNSRFECLDGRFEASDIGYVLDFDVLVDPSHKGGQRRPRPQLNERGETLSQQ